MSLGIIGKIRNFLCLLLGHRKDLTDKHHFYCGRCRAWIKKPWSGYGHPE